MNEEVSRRLLTALLAEDSESEWLEFKANNLSPEVMGERISALSNMAALSNRAYAYLVYGISDDKKVVGTTFDLIKDKVGNEMLKPHLEALVDPKLSILPIPVAIEGKKVVILRIPSAKSIPTSFRGEPYCRVGSATKLLSSRPDILSELMKSLETSKRELHIVKQGLSADEVFSALDVTAYYDLFGIYLPKKEEMLRKFAEERFLIHEDDGSFSITLLGAVCFAKRLSDFPALSKRIVRFVTYSTPNRIDGEDERFFDKGYALSFVEILDAIIHHYRKEKFEGAMRVRLDPYGEITLREALANMMIHGDLFARGSGPLIEAFPNRLEFSNPGALRFDVDRIIDVSPDATNELLADFMHRLGIGDERGSGFDKMLLESERRYAPSPLVENKPNGVSLTLFPPTPYGEERGIDIERDIYCHCCLRYLSGEAMTNASLRERYGLGEDKTVEISKRIRALVDKGRIKIVEGSSRKKMEYIPYWA